MKNNAYTASVDKLTAPELSVERAIRGAGIRAAKSASARVKTRYAAAAAGMVIASAAGAAVFSQLGKTPAPLSAVSLKNSSEATTVSTEIYPSQSGTTAYSHESDKTEAPSASYSTEEPIIISFSVDSGETASDPPYSTETPVSKETLAEHISTEPPTEESIEVPRIDVDIDASLLCEDGKLYCTIAQTGYNANSDPDAFSDDRVYYVETKFGRYKQPHPLEVSGIMINDDLYYHFYNSDGELLYKEALNLDQQ